MNRCYVVLSVTLASAVNNQPSAIREPLVFHGDGLLRVTASHYPYRGHNKISRNIQYVI